MFLNSPGGMSRRGYGAGILGGGGSGVAKIELSRVDRFAGTMILFWPFAWAVTLSANRHDIPMEEYILALISGFLGACLLHRCGGCIWNDIIDMDLDAQVERTKHRPLPDGRITVPQALVFLSIHVALLFAMARYLNPTAWVYAFLTIVPLTGMYPFMKRITYLPQVWLGITLNTPVLIASTIFAKQTPQAAFLLAFGGWCWTMWYDTIYGSQDKIDDIKAGVKSIVLLLASHARLALFFFSSAMTLCLLATGILNGAGLAYFLVAVGGGGSLLARDLVGVDLDDPKSCLTAFQRNGFTIGPVIFVGCLLDYLL
ncbi:4-hydroxybenzoate polyprenyl transferase [Roridomyces roridus]|uniref:4-hydroxybenzoate polyprenyl transferase n=1 Tax=Roridomyces roridus TaxID=1738132 RepID=A0AAD7CC87_9AGAR|nr:4-hydroxybenzoate polyprenyl transferase [Roridomyces roridus]